jgi:hypothetical protein
VLVAIFGNRRIIKAEPTPLVMRTKQMQPAMAPSGPPTQSHKIIMPGSMIHEGNRKIVEKTATATVKPIAPATENEKSFAKAAFNSARDNEVDPNLKTDLMAV